MVNEHFIVEIATAPKDIERYKGLAEEEKSKLLNPIDSKIIGIGIRSKGQNKAFISDDEKKILESFWSEWQNIKRQNAATNIVGFNIHDFDLPFITTRSFINNVPITPFVIKNVIDLRDKLSAYRSGYTRGKLKEFGAELGFDQPAFDESEIANLYIYKSFKQIEKSLMHNLELVDRIYQRIVDTNIVYINRW